MYFELDSQKDLYTAMHEDLSTATTDISAMGSDEIAKLKSFDCWCNGDKDPVSYTHLMPDYIFLM